MSSSNNPFTHSRGDSSNPFLNNHNRNDSFKSTGNINSGNRPPRISTTQSIHNAGNLSLSFPPSPSLDPNNPNPFSSGSGRSTPAGLNITNTQTNRRPQTPGGLTLPPSSSSPGLGFKPSQFNFSHPNPANKMLRNQNDNNRNAPFGDVGALPLPSDSDPSSDNQDEEPSRPTPLSLSPFSADSLLSHLQSRYISHGMSYTQIGHDKLIVINPNRWTGEGDEEVLRELGGKWIKIEEGGDHDGEMNLTGGDSTGDPAGEGKGKNNFKSRNKKHPQPQPSIFEISGGAYYWMRRTGGDQSVVLSGETGSGKSENRRLLIRSLIDLSSTPALTSSKRSNPSRSTKLSLQIPSSDFILESFGSCSTLSNTNSSRFGKYTELQFNQTGKLYGCKGLEYYLEKERVVGTNTPLGERNFHVFYYLVAGATKEEKEHLKLPMDGDPSHFRYLSRGGGGGALAGNRRRSALSHGLGGSGGAMTSDPLDLPKFKQLKEAFKAVGYPRKAVASVFQTLATVLHLGNLEFGMPSERKKGGGGGGVLSGVAGGSGGNGGGGNVKDGATGVNGADESAVVLNPEILSICSEFLGVRSEDLEDCLTVKTAMVGGERCTVFLDQDGASDNRDDLAKLIYGLVFSWLGEFGNEKLCKEDFSTFIGVVDFPGPQRRSGGGTGGSGGRGNGLDEFCFNLASERIWNLVLKSNFDDKKKMELDKDGLVGLIPGTKKLFDDSKFFDNSETVRLLINRPGGLVHIIDDQSSRPKNKNDSTMLKAMAKRWGNHSSFGYRDVGDQRAGGGLLMGTVGNFLISHWDGQVNYEAEGFLERNREQVGSDWVHLFGGRKDPRATTATAAAKRPGGSRSPGPSTPTGTAITATIGGSSQPFIKSLFAGEALETEYHPRSENTIIGAKQNVGPMRAPSTRRVGGRGKGTIKRKLTKKKTANAGEGDGDEDRISEEGDGYNNDQDDAIIATSGAAAGDDEKLSPNMARGYTLKDGGAGALNKDSNDKKTGSIVGQFDQSLELLIQTLSETKPWFVFCLRPNDAQLPNQIDARLLRHQIRAMNLAEMANRVRAEGCWAASLEIREWWERYGEGDEVKKLDEMREVVKNMGWRDKVLKAKDALGWTDQDMAIGKEKVLLSAFAFRELEDWLRAQDEDEVRRWKERQRQDFEIAAGLGTPDPFSPFPQSPFVDYNDDYAKTSSLPLVSDQQAMPRTAYQDDDDNKTFFSETDYFTGRPRSPHDGGEDSRSAVVGSEYAPSKNMFQGMDKKPLNEKAGAGGMGGMPDAEETIEEVKETSGRKKWVALVWALTFWVPNFLLSWIGRMKRRDIRMAWREKLAINMLIWFVCGSAIFVLAIMGNLICPREFVFTQGELQDHSFIDNVNNMLVSIRGEVFDLTSFAPHHNPGNNVIATRNIQKYGGQDISDFFPVQVSAVCNGVDGTVNPFVSLNFNNDTNVRNVAQYHDFTAASGDYRPDWYYEQMIYLRYNYRRGFVGYKTGSVKKLSSNRNVVIYKGGIYDMTDYIHANGGVLSIPDNTAPPDGDINTSFMDPNIVSLFKTRSGHDITRELNALNMKPEDKQRQLVCMRNLFFIGKQDNRNSAKCLFARYILLAFSIVMVSVIGFKFLAALQFGRSRPPQDHDKFVICQVPCYTEGEESLRRCIDSLTTLKYDDKRKLLFVVCDGMIIGSGNDRPTPRIVLDILGCDPMIDPEPLSFQSVGEGAKQHNMGKVYSGLHEAAGHIVPYIVVVKVGKPTERSRPGNRGKRDSQMIVMRFLNRVHFDAPMSPLELEVYHQIKNVIGVSPAFYEYILQVDADTVVDKWSLNRMVSSMMHDGKIMGLCGETGLINAKQSFTTMLQVYEYFISHHLAKAFESLFGSVTCLPGCFSLYRIRTLESRPLICSNQIVEGYGENRLDTLHMKNLLSLGEDRYLTTLMLKTFPNYRLVFVKDAYAQTIAPDQWKVLLSQRRRWINSTVHNLAELMWIDRLCGFCLFSMRFVVFIDLTSTIIQPVTVAYLAYLFYLIGTASTQIPLFSIIMLAAVYGLQALIFILHRKFEHIGWMVLYIIGIPIFSFLIPLVSFWQMDNFSWGNTRVVLGEKGKRLVVHEEGKFDPSEIPLKRWQDYEEELWERGSNHSIGSYIPDRKVDFGDDYHSRDNSVYGMESSYNLKPPQFPGSRQGSRAPSLAGIRAGGPATTPSEFGAPTRSNYFPAAGGQQSGPPSEYGARSTYGGYVAPPGGMGALPGYGGAMGGGMGGGYAPSVRSSFFFGGGAGGFPAAGMPGTMSVRSSAFFGGGGPQGGAPPSMYNAGNNSMMNAAPVGGGGQIPSEEVISADVRTILATADLNTITKKGIRQQLEARYSAPLGTKKDWVNKEIERALGY